MFNLYFRVIILYFFILVSMRLMGKRQLGQMQMSELVTAFFLSELATYTVTEKNTSLLVGGGAILLIVAMEVLVSFLTVKIPLFKKMFDFAPSPLIWEGKVQEANLLKTRMTIDELLSFLRLGGYPNINHVRFAFLEPNGQLSIIPFGTKSQPNCEDIGVSGDDSGYTLAVIDDGVINLKALNILGKEEKWVKKKIRFYKKKGANEFFLLSSDLNGNTNPVFRRKK